MLLRNIASPWLILLVLRCLAELNNDTSPTHVFKSRPDIHAPIIDLTILRPELLSPGYIFLGPYRSIAPGPHIYDNHGELVWAGAGSAGPKTAHYPHVCRYKKKDHLCYFQGDQHHGFARGFGVIMDNTYRIVKTVESAGAGASSDMHEFRLIGNGKTALITVYQTKRYDLTVNARFNMQKGLGWIQDGVFQEIDVETGKLLFEWRSLDHVDPQESWVMPGTTDTSGNGLDLFNAWDYFHINSVDKTKHGDYIVSARHACAIYKISGRDGKVLWQLGGSKSTFATFPFGYQHDVRWLSDNKTHTMLSFFDNAGNSYNQTSSWSRGLVVAIDHVAKQATIVKSWLAPEAQGGIRSGSQGSMQLLPNGGAHIAWGEHARISEHTADGSAVMYGKLALRESAVMIYRSTKSDWKGYPRTHPTMWTFSKTGEDTRFFISWNGATEVRAWLIFQGQASGPFARVASLPKRGFETELLLSDFYQWTYAEAIDAKGKVLGKTPVTRTFVPSPGLLSFCDDRGCQDNEAVAENHTTPYNAEVYTAAEMLSTNRGFDTTLYYPDGGSTTGSVWQASAPKPGSTIIWLGVCTLMGLAALWALKRGRYAGLMELRRLLVHGSSKRKQTNAWELISTPRAPG